MGKEKQLHIKVDEVEREWLDEYCEVTGKSISDVIRDTVHSLPFKTRRLKREQEKKENGTK